ncbi:carbon-nitrogen hydrolase family protein [Archaeoglobus veneficus]|uniref:Nitrilase/cyanide hydratase and apolipoprotein N-acyltransferase n=1 Tax=Archaeoglobus veneficus (strain DSM 11195 / SNP6) TaxID=693661 RepID=F2KSZ4_ARCVS|nr:carbon-nitrogen hydrolase family protein [Archaeoglobus veneficus]AEA47024.1 Nitrilase/cyanide hydratase and apolipoprotein N-acyltransferase [Archaeoglobus veneficus SNP6]
MRVTVCELPDSLVDETWENLVRHVRKEQSELVVLPEMPACPWFASMSRFDERVWQEALQAHDALMTRLDELTPATVISTRPVQDGAYRLNQAFFWNEGYCAIRTKYYLPDEEGFYEASWFHRGEKDFTVFRTRGIAIGVLICSELMFNEWARLYGKQGAHIIAVPRATERKTLDRWLVALRMAAIVSGAFVLSSNRVGKSGDAGGVEFGGCGWIISPEGDVLASTSRSKPFITMDIDLNEAVCAKRTYPRYIPE